jgi:hypothetical protein
MIILIILAFCFQTAIAEGQQLIQTDKETYNYGEAITVHFYEAPGYASDWICIVPAGSPDTEAGDYKYIPEEVKQGVLIFKSPRPGQYEARAYYNYNAFRYTVSGRYLFTIKGDAYGYNDEYGEVYGSGYGSDYVDVPIVYGEPYYFSPPIVVTYPYDYYTYEMVGGFVDIVFWRGGHRYRHERWHDNGRFVSDADMRSRRLHQKIRGSEFNQYREKLRQNHNISHPDSYYGLKSPSNRQMERSPRRMEQRPQRGQRQTRQVQQQPRLVEQGSQSGQRQTRQVQQQPRRVEQGSQSGQRQSRRSGSQHQQDEQKH